MADQLHAVSLSFLVDDLQVRRGGVAANICFGMGVLGHKPYLLSAVGHDFAEYRDWLERAGVQCDHVHISKTAHTARFMCTTDEEQNQIASFYPGAMAESAQVNIPEISKQLGGLDFVLIGAADPDAMVQVAKDCKANNIKFISDPSQQLPRLDDKQTMEIVDGAYYLFNNEYEAKLIEERTGWTPEEVLHHVNIRVTTLGKNGAHIQSRDGLDIRVHVAQPKEIKDPTGVGDAFRAGFLAGLSWGLELERSAQVGSLLATYVIETVGTQEFDLQKDEFISRFAAAYGNAAADEIKAHL